MNNLIIKWGLMLLLAIIISVFLHEVGHGISAYYQGLPVSTGFNRVGDINKRPGDDNFRKEMSSYDFSWDLGVPFTLGLALISTFILHKVSNKTLVLIIGAVAFTNALLRLIPMINSYGHLLFAGSLYIEDEVSIGLRWYKSTGIVVFKHLPSLISVTVSLVCYKLTLRQLKLKLPELINVRYFTYVTILILVFSFSILNILDKYLRINWG